MKNSKKALHLFETSETFLKLTYYARIYAINIDNENIITNVFSNKRLLFSAKDPQVTL